MLLFYVDCILSGLLIQVRHLLVPPIRSLLVSCMFFAWIFFVASVVGCLFVVSLSISSESIELGIGSATMPQNSSLIRISPTTPNAMTSTRFAATLTAQGLCCHLFRRSTSRANSPEYSSRFHSLLGCCGWSIQYWISDEMAFVEFASFCFSNSPSVELPIITYPRSSRF